MSVELSEAERRFLRRVHQIKFVPWSGKVSAADAKGKAMRLSKATFEKLKGNSLIIREESTLTADIFVVQNPAVIADADAVAAGGR